MFCPNCGNELNDDAMFCGACGTRMDAAAVTPEGNPEAQPQPGTQPQPGVQQQPVQRGKASLFSNPKMSGILKKAAIVILVIAALLVVKNIFGGGSYKAPLKEAVGLANKRSTSLDAYAGALLPKFANRAYRNGKDILSEYDEMEEGFNDLEEALGDMFEELDDTYGSDWKITYKIVEKERIDKSDLKDLKKNYKNLREELDRTSDYLDRDGYYYEEFKDEIGSNNMKKLKELVQDLDSDLKELDITDGYYLELELVIKGGEDEDDASMEVSVLKINGKWTLDILSSASMLNGFF